MGDGSRTRFWHYVWCGDPPLKDTFPLFFAMQGIGMIWWLILGWFTMTWYIGTLILSDWHTIRRWTLFPLFSMLCIPLGWVAEVTISYVGVLRKKRSFEVKSF